MIPKIIHAAWVSDKPMPDERQYIESWRRVLPDYELRIYGTDDLADSPCVRGMMKRGKPVSAAQYTAFKALHESGGVYMDLDMEVLRPFDELLGDKMFLGAEIDSGAVWVNCAIVGAEKGHPFLAECLTYMDAFDLDHPQVENELGPRMFTNLLKARGWRRRDRDRVVDGIHVCESKRFYPYRWDQQYDPEYVTPQTLAVHHWATTWEQDTVSIVIPCYNHAGFLHEAIQSALAQRHKPLEVIVVNDGSTDNTSEVARKYPVHLIEQENRGLSAARNAGIAAARGRYVVCLDADDRLHKDYLRRAVGVDDIVSPSIMMFGSSTRQWNPPIKHPTYDDFSRKNRIVCSAMFLREIWERVGGYDEAMRDGYEDWDFWTRATHAGYTVTVLREHLYFYRKHADDRSGVQGSVDWARQHHDEIVAYMAAKNLGAA